MRIRAEQLVNLTMNYRVHHLNRVGPLNAEEVRSSLLSDHPDLEGVLPPPNYDQILHLYLPRSWQRLQMRAPYHPQRQQIRPLTDANLRPVAPAPRLERGSIYDEFAQTPPPDPVQQILDDLDVLRGDPMAALTYVCHRARGIDSREAMLWARLTANVHALLQITPGYIRADRRAEDFRNRQAGMGGIRQSAAHQAWAPDTVPVPPLSSVPSVDPGEVRAGLERLERQAALAHH